MGLKRSISVAVFIATLVVPSQALAINLAEIIQDGAPVYKTPGAPHSARIKTLFRYVSINGQPNRMPVVGTKQVGDQMWLHVRLSGRPNGGKGWFEARYAKLIVSRYRISIDLSQRYLRVFLDNKKVKASRVIIGAPATPTPTGDFFAVDGTRLDAAWANSGWALATSAFSDVLKHFDGGEGQVAIHTTGNFGDRLGSAASHGCVRVPPRFAKWLAFHIPNGTPIIIRH